MLLRLALFNLKDQTMMSTRTFLSVGVALSPVLAWAGSPVPAPVAGAFGPAGLGVAAVGYVVYRIIKRNK